MRAKFAKLVLVAVLPLCVLLLGALLLQGDEQVAQADEPILSTAVSWPPIHKNLSKSPKYAGASAIDVNEYGAVVAWSEGDTNPNGTVKMAWYDKTGTQWDVRQIEDRGGYVAFSPAVALAGTKAHFVWVTKAGTAYGVFYRYRDLTSQSWSAIERVDGPLSEELGGARIAVTADGEPHVVWVRRVALGSPPEWRHRIFYATRSGGVWVPEPPISGWSEAGDSKSYSQDMPAIVAKGGDVYVAWREKYKGDLKGIWFRHRTSGGVWEPTPGVLEPYLLGQQLSDSGFDEFPTMDAAGDRVYVMWDRYLRQKCDALGSNCVQVYSMTYRVLTGTHVTTDWWPGGTDHSQSQQMVYEDLAGEKAIFASSSVSTANGEFDPDFGVPVADDYYSGVRPSIKVVQETSGAYRPYVIWHHWSHSSVSISQVDDTDPYQVFYSYIEDGDLETATWQYPIPIKALGSDRIFAVPDLALAPASGGGYEPHVALLVRLGDEDGSWDVVYTNLNEYHWVYLPMVLKN
jgi:hypothetical protein